MAYPTHEITREYWFSAAHRLEGHPKCGRLHGHNYKVTIGVGCNDVSEHGWVIDYAELDKLAKPIVDELDHKYLVSAENVDANCPYSSIALLAGHALLLPKQRSTAELIASFLFDRVWKVLPGGLELTFVEVYETPKSSAVFYGP